MFKMELFKDDTDKSHEAQYIKTLGKGHAGVFLRFALDQDVLRTQVPDILSKTVKKFCSVRDFFFGPLVALRFFKNNLCFKDFIF